MPTILITNDDGVYSPGLQAACEVADQYGDLLIAAPISQQTGMGRSFPRTSDQGIIEETYIEVNGKKQIAYGVHGSPAYAVAHGILELTKEKPILCISGINYGENLGMVFTCSGTIGAAIEAVSHGVSSVAISLEADLSMHRQKDYPELSWEMAKQVLDLWIPKALEGDVFPGADFLNINVPSDLNDRNRYQITRQSRQNYFILNKPEKRDFTKPYELKSRLQVDLDTLEKDSDIYATYVDRVTSVTPVTCDMTAGIDSGI